MIHIHQPNALYRLWNLMRAISFVSNGSESRYRMFSKVSQFCCCQEVIIFNMRSGVPSVHCKADIRFSTTCSNFFCSVDYFVLCLVKNRCIHALLEGCCFFTWNPTSLLALFLNSYVVSVLFYLFNLS